MKNKITLYITLAIFILGAIIAMSLIIATPFVAKNNTTIVKTYESGLDEIDLEYDEDNHQYDVYVGNEDKGTLKHYIVKLEDVVLIPDVDNEVHFEITKSGKCKLYFFIKWEVE